jgi:hypothetical protein
VHDIEVQTGLLRIDVCGKLQVKHIGEVIFFRDRDGVEHDAETFYSDYVPNARLQGCERSEHALKARVRHLSHKKGGRNIR